MSILQVGRLSAAKEVIQNLWGETEVERAIEDFQSVTKDAGSDLDSRWWELLQEPHSRGCIRWFTDVMFKGNSMLDCILYKSPFVQMLEFFTT